LKLWKALLAFMSAADGGLQRSSVNPPLFYTWSKLANRRRQ
jgi:hypothetical protein